jgi:hypothetical protein
MTAMASSQIEDLIERTLDVTKRPEEGIAVSVKPGRPLITALIVAVMVAERSAAQVAVAWEDGTTFVVDGTSSPEGLFKD